MSPRTPASGALLLCHRLATHITKHYIFVGQKNGRGTPLHLRRGQGGLGLEELVLAKLPRYALDCWCQHVLCMTTRGRRHAYPTAEGACSRRQRVVKPNHVRLPQTLETLRSAPSAACPASKIPEMVLSTRHVLSAVLPLSPDPLVCAVDLRHRSWLEQLAAERGSVD